MTWIVKSTLFSLKRKGDLHVTLKQPSQNIYLSMN